MDGKLIVAVVAIAIIFTLAPYIRALHKHTYTGVEEPELERPKLTGSNLQAWATLYSAHTEYQLYYSSKYLEDYTWQLYEELTGNPQWQAVEHPNTKKED